MLLTIDLMTLFGRDDLATRRPRLDSGREVDLGRALSLLEQAKLTSVLMLGPWRAVAVGRTHRTLARVVRDALLPLIVRMTADSRAHEGTFDYHIDWDAPAPATL